MADQFLMALGLNYAVADKRQTSSKELAAKDLPSITTALRALRPSMAVSEIEKNQATVTFDKYEDAEDLIKSLYTYCADHNERLTEEDKLYFDVIVMLAGAHMEARAINLLTKIVERRELSSNYAVKVYITTDIYQNLIPRHQDFYHAAIEVGTTAVHQRFSDEVQRCFVISPIGDSASAIRERADLVFERYIKPACENTPFRPVRGEMMRGNYIMSDLMDALQSDPMVIVYLGPPKLGYNPNVMFEFGGRNSIGGPYIVIKDATSEGKPYTLPFDLKDNRVVDIPEQEEAKLDEAKLDDVAVKIRTIRERILASVHETEWDDIHPRATVDMKIGDPEGASKFTWASKDTETLFDVKGIVGKALNPVIKRLLQNMPACQRGPFVDEQSDLIGRLVVPRLVQRIGEIRNIHATVPIVFETHNTYKGRAFLPVISSYSFTEITNNLRLRILYIDVTSATKWNKEKGHYICFLTGKDAKVDLKPDAKIDLKPEQS